MTSPTHFQRRRRSEETVQAITYQLDHVLQEFNMELLLLADNHGLPIAFAGDEEAAQAFAAFAKSLEQGAKPDPMLSSLIENLGENKILCEILELEELPLYLLAVMSPDIESARGFERARTGIQRIYRTTGTEK